MKPLKELTRPNIWNLAPYSCARNEYSGKQASVFLDANENPYNTPYNRYPDPLQLELKARISAIKGVPAENIFLGNGSDEAIDLAYRCFTNPGKDNVVAIEPTYGMYRVCADINGVEYRTVLLNDKYQLDADAVLAACDDNTKIIWLCSPNNPTGNNLDRDAMMKIISSFSALVVVDEAYGDFTQQHSMRTELVNHPNLIVLNTMSKAWACAGLRLGMAYASVDIINIYNKVKYPYNVNILTQQKALETLKDPYQVDSWVHTIIMERDRVIEAFKLLPVCEEVYPTDANFFLAKMNDAKGIYNYLVDNGIIVRNRTNVTLCHNCLRITIGTRSENMRLLSALRTLA
ncbi:MAG: histidinol-phosphate transaminase [Prevotella sp.]|nr:histidinol-phosphate transaminase [Prevotella sp.]MBO5205721.1 histidinol-phosphate transaminase [Prevotella sp.]